MSKKKNKPRKIYRDLFLNFALGISANMVSAGLILAGVFFIEKTGWKVTAYVSSALVWFLLAVSIKLEIFSGF